MFSAATKEASSDVVKDVKATAYNAKRDLREASKDARVENHGMLTEYAEKAGREVRHLIDVTGDQLNHAGQRVTDEIRNNPIRSSAIALGAGLILGLLARR